MVNKKRWMESAIFHILMWSLFEPNLNTCKTFEMKPFSLLSCSGMCCMELDVHRVWSDNVLLWSYEISSYHFHLNDILVKWHIKQCAHVVVVLVLFAKKKIQLLTKGFEMQTKCKVWFAFCLCGGSELCRLSLISSAAAIWAKEAHG